MFQSIFRFIVRNVVNRVRVSVSSVIEQSHFGGAIPSKKPSHIQDQSSCLLLIPATLALMMNELSKLPNGNFYLYYIFN